MVVDDGEQWKWLWGLFVTGTTAVMGFFGVRAVNKLDDVSSRADQNTLDLEKYKTEVANTYSKEANTQLSLGRIHDRLDDVATDIKTLLQRGHP